MAFYNTLPLYGALLAFLFLGERLGPAHLAGGALIILGGLWAARAGTWQITAAGGPGNGRLFRCISIRTYPLKRPRAGRARCEKPGCRRGWPRSYSLLQASVLICASSWRNSSSPTRPWRSFERRLTSASARSISSAVASSPSRWSACAIE